MSNDKAAAEKMDTSLANKMEAIELTEMLSPASEALDEQTCKYLLYI